MFRGRLGRRALPGCTVARTGAEHGRHDVEPVVHSPCGSIVTLNVKPLSSSRAGAVAEISVSRRNVSRS